MSWVRYGDESATHPIVVEPLNRPDGSMQLVNEAFGFVGRCAIQSGLHLTDYVVTHATAAMVAGMERVDFILQVAIEAGYMTPVEIDGKRSYKIVDDDTFIHLRLKKEVEWDQQRQRDNSNTAITVPVRLRDGDTCRWCGVVVNWRDRKGARGATYDHLEAKQRDTTPETVVVACKSCNSSRKDTDTPKGIDQLLPVPNPPYFSESTVTWLTNNKWREDRGLPVPKPSTTQIPIGYRTDGSQPPIPDTPRDRDARSESRSAPSGRASTDPDNQSGTQQPSPPVSPTPADRVQCPTDEPGSLQRKPFEPHRQDRGTADQQHQGQPPPDDDAPAVRGIPQIPADGEYREKARTGRVGTGRDGTALVGGPATAGGEGPAMSPARKRRRGSRRRKQITKP